jgi:peptidoglycan/xylan/chitin deacetylase (PgdA/CDA1 family)
MDLWRSVLRAVLATAVILWAGCSMPIESTTPTSSPIPSPTATPTPNPTATATSSPTLTPSPIPSPTSPPQMPVPTAQPPVPSGSAPLIYHGSRSAPLIAITIDDCDSDAVVLSILAILQRERVNATFFPIGTQAAAAPATWQRVAAAGFPIANHTWSHPNLTRLSYAQVVSQISLADQRISAITGEPLLPVIRPPGGNWNQTVLKAAAATGKRAVVIWDTSFGDTGRGTVDQMIANGIRGTNGSIVLMHANLSISAEALPSVIASYRSRGFSFVTVGQLLGIPGRIPYPTGPITTPRPAPTSSPTPSPTAAPTPTPSPVPVVTPSTAPYEPTPAASIEQSPHISSP